MEENSKSDAPKPEPPTDIEATQELLDKLPPEAKQRVIEHIVHEQRIMFSGPLPIPGLMSAYEEIMPGSADRIFKMAEQDLTHDHTVELKLVSADIKSQDDALRYTFILAVLAILCGTVLIALGRDLAGFAIIGAMITGIAGIFFKRQRDKRELKKQEQKQDQ